MEYKIAICDDEQKDRDFVAALSRRWAGQRGNTVELTEFSSAEQFLFCYGEQSDYDILLLDIEMGQMDGVQLAKQLRGISGLELARRIKELHGSTNIVFVTGYSDYISEGYEVAALHYLMKPVREEKFFSVLDRAADKLRKNERTLTLECAGEVVRVPLYQIRYVDVQHNYATVHAKADYTVKKTLAEIEKSLDDRFYRVGRSAIVNLSCIARVTRSDIFLNEGDRIPLPRGAYEGVNRAIIQRG